MLPSSLFSCMNASSESTPPLPVKILCETPVVVTVLFVLPFRRFHSIFSHVYRQERQRYYANRQLSIENSSEYLSIIQDGMDQIKTNVPHLIRLTKSCQNLWCLRTHLTGCLVHGVGNFGYFDYMQWPHDCNLTLTTLLLTLLEINKMGKRPRYLQLQMDNCVRENKSKYVLGFLALLVEREVFVEASYLQFKWCICK